MDSSLYKYKALEMAVQNQSSSEAVGKQNQSLEH